MLNAAVRNMLLGRNVMRTFIRNESHGGVPGENLPFQISNRYRFTIVFSVFIASGVGAPFLITAYQMKKQ